MYWQVRLLCRIDRCLSSLDLVCLICCQIQAKPTNNDESELHDHDFVRQFLSNEQEQSDHQQYRRASLRYHPHILYKKASLKPLIGHNGKMTFGDRERY